MALSGVRKRQRIKSRIRRAVRGTVERPRLVVFRNNNEIYIQTIDDIKGTALLAASSRDKELSAVSDMKIEKVVMVGKVAAEKTLKQGIERVSFDRGGYLYHRRVKPLAEGIRESGLKF